MTAHAILQLTGTLMQFFVTGLLLGMPALTPRGLLFGVPVPEGFRSTDTGLQALRSYRLWVSIPGVTGILANLLYPNPGLQSAYFVSVLVFGISGYLRQNAKLKPFAIQPAMTREAALGTPERLPWFIWLGVLPLLFLVGAGMYLRAHWDQIPMRYPIHFDVTGAPNRWANKSVAGVYGMLIFGAQFGMFFFGMMFAAWYGTRRSDPMRRPMLLVLLAGEIMITLTVGLIPLRSAAGLGIPPWGLLLPTVVLFAALGNAARVSSQRRGPVDPTPNECWKGGMLYSNPNDAALFVQRRDSLGFTVNFGNRWSWALVGFLVLQLLSVPVLIKMLSS